MSPVEANPPLTPAERAAVVPALELASVVGDGRPASYTSAWRAAGLVESTGRGEDAPDDDYTRSPRSTLGATRA